MEKIKKRDKERELLSKISETIVSNRYLDEILNLVMTVTAEMMGSKICSLWILEKKQSVLKLRATQSIDKEYLKERVLKVGEGVVGDVAVQKKPMLIFDILKEPKYKEKHLAKKLGLSSMLSIPMQVKGKIIGVVNSYTSKPHQFTKAEIETLTTVANQAALAIENTRLMEETLKARESLKVRKLVEQAKGILIREFKMTEDQAYKNIHKKSMDSRKSMKEVAEAIILSLGK